MDFSHVRRPQHRPLRTFGRIKSRPIKAKQAVLFDTLMPGIALPDPEGGADRSRWP